MNFNSGEFLLFLPIVVTVYWLLPYRWRWGWLLGASYYFYMAWNPWLVILLLTATLVSYFSALLIERYPERKRIFLIVTLVVCLGILAYFKYANFFLNTALDLLGREPVSLNILLPIGISFYTFQTLSYVIDVYRGDFRAESHLGHYALYVVFFPQLVAGPIENPRNLLPQLKAEHRLNWDDFSAGIRLLLCGFFRKCVVADLCGIYVNIVFAVPEQADGLAIFFAGALFCIQMYCDFAGYSEIASGAARLMGVRLMRNFDQPYLAQSYTEFFHRWHISLNQWFTSYLYIPLGGGRKGRVRKIVNTFIVFSLCGLWHGARWTYVLWGLYAACFVCVESLLRGPAHSAVDQFRLDLNHPLVKLVRRSYMFLIFIPAALIFRADSMEQLSIVFARLLTTDWSVTGALSTMGITSLSMIQLVLILIAMARLAPWGRQDLPGARSQTASVQRLTSSAYMALIVALSWIALLATQDAVGFAYFQF